jgi:chitin disaccharide deacetylase
LIHPSYEDAEMRIMTSARKDYNSSWRQADFDFFTSDECKQIILENDIKLITWREIYKNFKKTT